MLTGDVSFQLCWQLHEQKRLESSNSADLDNILKPLIDSCCGLNAVLIDDNQLDNICVQWANYYDYDNDKIIVTINFNPSETIPKEKLVFVAFDTHLYLPMTLHDNIPQRIKDITELEGTYSKRQQAVETQGYLRATRRKHQMQRVYHLGRLGDYTKMSKEEYRTKVL